MHNYSASMAESTGNPETTWSTVRLSVDAIQVLAHPLRSRLLSALRLDGAATATALAERLDTNTGATSYHLRKLASVRLVEETGEGRGRERWWRATTDMHNWNDDVTEGDPDARAAAGWLREHYVRSFVEHAEHWLAHHDKWPIEWRRLAGSSDYILELTPRQLEALMRELSAVVARVHEETTAIADADADKEAAGPARVEPAERPQRVLLFIHDFPEGERPR
jgi:DNA-binding transcriptional ArsR family regulator